MYGQMLSALINDDMEEIFSIYDRVIDTSADDRELVIRLMAYMYSMRFEEAYLNLLKIYGKIAQNDSETAYYVGFYFLIKNSHYHAFISFRMVKEDENAYLFRLSRKNMSMLENANARITYIMRNSLESAIKNDPGNNSLNEQLRNLDDIESKMTETVVQMIDFAKRTDDKEKLT